MSDSSPPSSATQEAGPNPEDDESTGVYQSPGTVEKTMMLAGIILTLAVLLYAAWHVVAVPASDAPRATVVGTETLPDGRIAVHVELSIPENNGLIAASVSSQCTSPPSTVSFSNLPEGSRWRGTIVCPAGTTDPSVSVSDWIET